MEVDFTGLSNLSEGGKVWQMLFFPYFYGRERVRLLDQNPALHKLLEAGIGLALSQLAKPSYASLLFLENISFLNVNIQP
ncbi:hypothetical protein CEXT_772791 [Caerostris extrusa]|uniref:STAS domain-containing protein n=1 Tax=Caerostris extrusa TaxID=172846 RepID=A0AAV4UET0_CAEEX|nr:hypothetical protein CEXT_772791 [Caerostris extrusa]